VVFFPTRYVSLGSISAACAFPVLYVVLAQIRNWPMTGSQLPLLIFACVIALLIVWKHRTNISRLLKGTENKFQKKVVHE
jgi:glycerol-3-phosphate acyltransferase PlsY